MGLGVLEPSTESHVAGTVILRDEFAREHLHTSRLKHGTGKSANIVLNPQPSDDPNDPLGWSSWEKHLILGILAYGCIVTACVTGPLLNAGTVEIAEELQVSVAAIARVSGYLLLAAGASGPFMSAFARKYGKRPVYIFSSTMALIGCIVGEVAKDYSTLIAARAIQGLSCAAYESLVLSSIGDLFYVHERSPRIAIIMFMLTAVNNGVSIIAGPITARLGWSYNFHILLPFTALQVILLFLFCPETTYNRNPIYNTDVAASEEDLERLGDIEKRHRQPKMKEAPQEATDFVKREEEVRLERAPTQASHHHPRKSFVQRLALYNGAMTPEPIWKMLLACPAILLNFGALYSILTSGIIIAWSVALSVISAVLWTAPPYNLSAAGVGYVSVGPLIGGCLGALLYSLISDRLIQKLAARNQGVYEPEFKLTVVLVGFVPCVAGLIGFGYSNEKFDSIYVISFLWGVALFGVTLLVSVPTAYALDAYRSHSVEIFIMNMTFKNFFFYGLTNYIVDWYFDQGVRNMFNTIGGITVGLALTTAPVYVWGKKYRHWWQHHNLLKKWGLQMDGDVISE